MISEQEKSKERNGGWVGDLTGGRLRWRLRLLRLIERELVMGMWLNECEKEKKRRRADLKRWKYPRVTMEIWAEYVIRQSISDCTLEREEKRSKTYSLDSQEKKNRYNSMKCPRRDTNRVDYPFKKKIPPYLRFTPDKKRDVIARENRLLDNEDRRPQFGLRTTTSLVVAISVMFPTQTF